MAADARPSLLPKHWESRINSEIGEMRKYRSEKGIEKLNRLNVVRRHVGEKKPSGTEILQNQQ